MRLRAFLVALGNQLHDVLRQCKQMQLGLDFDCARRQETLEAPVVLELAKAAFRLSGAIDTQELSFLSGNAL